MITQKSSPHLARSDIQNSGHPSRAQMIHNNSTQKICEIGQHHWPNPTASDALIPMAPPLRESTNTWFVYESTEALDLVGPRRWIVWRNHRLREGSAHLQA